MAATNLELSNFFDQFYRLKNAGQKANLYVGCDAWCQVFVNLQVHLGPHPHEPDQHSHGYQDRHQNSPEHHNTRPEAEQYHRHHRPRPHPEPYHRHHDQPRARPSYLRRIERRKQARAAVSAQKTADNVFMQSDSPSQKLSAVKAVKTATEEVAIGKAAEEAVNGISAAALLLPLLSAEESAPPLPPPSEQDHHLGPPSQPTFSSFCFHVPEDSPQHPNIPTVPTRRPTVRSEKPPRPSWAVPTPNSSSDPNRVRMKPAKYLKSPLTLYIEKAIWDTQDSGKGRARWVGDTCAFVTFAYSEEGLYTEPRLV